MRGVVGVFTTPNYSASMRHWKSRLKETFVTVMGKIAVRPVFRGFFRSGPNVTSMVTTMKMMAVAACMTMPAIDASRMIAKQLYAEPSISTVPVGQCPPESHRAPGAPWPARLPGRLQVQQRSSASTSCCRGAVLAKALEVLAKHSACTMPVQCPYSARNSARCEMTLCPYIH